jgi:hypothetical protein
LLYELLAQMTGELHVNYPMLLAQVLLLLLLLPQLTSLA